MAKFMQYQTAQAIQICRGGGGNGIADVRGLGRRRGAGPNAGAKSAGGFANPVAAARQWQVKTIDVILPPKLGELRDQRQWGKRRKSLTQKKRALLKNWCSQHWPFRALQIIRFKPVASAPQRRLPGAARAGVEFAALSQRTPFAAFTANTVVTCR
jgi:hypothetical protein